MPPMMAMVLRHLLSIAILPLSVTVLIPWWLARLDGVSLSIAHEPRGLAIQLLGVVFLAVGLALFIASVREFIVRGRGTLAPWDPPRYLVVQGPYRYVRNPMISGVAFIVVAEALLLLSRPHGLWALLVLGLNLVYIPLLEEPPLELRFGDSYRTYCRHVRRIVPRLRPWNGDPGAL
jgi:protein-S-isoprenylcysteine O-methyltransferase Ste14